MSEISPLSIDEWFLAKQLRNIKKGLHLPYNIKADITVFLNHYRERNSRPPLTALLIKSSSQLINEMPEINQACFHTFYGLRKIRPTYNVVNIPMVVNIDGKSIVTATTIENAYQKTLSQIHEEVKTKRPTNFEQMPLNKIIHLGKFRIWQKIRLSLFHFIYSNFPNFYLKNRGGGICVSSLLNLAKDDCPVTMNAYGMTTFTISSCSIEKSPNDHIETICVGVAFDHLITHGMLGTRGIIRLSEIIRENAKV